MNKSESGAPISTMSRSITFRCILTVIIFLLILFAGYFAVWFVCTRFVWQPDDRLYQVLKIFEALSPVIIVIAIILGIFFIMRHYFAMPLKYLDEVILAAKNLALSPEHQVTLSKELKETQNELNLVRERALNHALMAKESEERKNDLVVYLAHDLKTPLTSIIGYLTLLKEEPDLQASQRAKYTGIALEKAERLEDLINEFFEITRFSLSTLELQKQTVNLSRMMEQIASESEPILSEHHLTWELHIRDDIQAICDPDKMERVVDNLIRNAVAYSYENTVVRLTLDASDKYILLRIDNHGKTIPPEKLSRIFEQFFRLDASRASATGGSGLGLAIAKEIVEAHGGSIFAESDNEQISFMIQLPL